ncbi:uncharacterized protein LOC132639792 [Lycium barbarum]|uniref:uncharacterized protein LOC132639792 n=1 Tax=Lycium barbarum TaxID=112863 RepID=UPI00293EC895|nr:uncharacterized protein LOC132639792 [Lycium barbarum]
MEVDGQQTWLQKWTPDFKPVEDSPVVPVWVLLPELPYHLHAWYYLRQIVAPIGTPLSMDNATEGRTRPSVAKVRVEVDLTKTKIQSIWIGSQDEDHTLKGFNQRLEYEGVPKYCRHCKLLGHSILQCRKVKKKMGNEENKDSNNSTTPQTKEQEHRQEEDIGTTKIDCGENEIDDADNNVHTQRKEITAATANNNRDGAVEADETQNILQERPSKEEEKNKAGIDVAGGININLDESDSNSIAQRDQESNKVIDMNKDKEDLNRELINPMARRGESIAPKEPVSANTDDRNKEPIHLTVYLNWIPPISHIADEHTKNNEATSPEKEDTQESKNSDTGQMEVQSKQEQTRENKQISIQEDKGNSKAQSSNNKGKNKQKNKNKKATVLESNNQHITFEITDNCRNEVLYVSIVYAKCCSNDRRELWDSLIDLASSINGPWCVGGDFNVIMNSEEKIGGRPHRASKSLDFISSMEACGLTDLGFVGPKFTWCNNRGPGRRIWKRLDRICVNDQWLQHYQHNYIRNLSRTGSDHRPLLLKCHNEQQDIMRYFKFLNLWTTQPDFLSIVQDTWNLHVQGNAMWRLKSKLQAVGKKLSQWSKESIGDINE